MPRKIFPPPTTMAISTPLLAAAAISLAYWRVVSMFMPYSSSPINASPDSLSKSRLYFGLSDFSTDMKFPLIFFKAAQKALYDLTALLNLNSLNLPCFLK